MPLPYQSWLSRHIVDTKTCWTEVLDHTHDMTILRELYFGDAMIYKRMSRQSMFCKQEEQLTTSGQARPYTSWTPIWQSLTTNTNSAQRRSYPKKLEV